MKIPWSWFLVGAAVGAGLGWMRGQQATGGGRPASGVVTGAPNAPFQNLISGLRG